MSTGILSINTGVILTLIKLKTGIGIPFCCENPLERSALKITCEINMLIEGINRRIAAILQRMLMILFISSRRCQDKVL